MKKAIFAILAIAAAVGLVGGAFAYFSDTATSSDNTFTTGTLDLKISNDGSSWAEGTSATFSIGNLAPGQSITRTVFLWNAGNVDAKAVYEDFDWNGATGYGDLANYIEVTEISDSIPWGANLAYGTNYVPNFIKPEVDLNADGHLSLYELATWGDRKVTSGSPRPWDIRTTYGEDPSVGSALPGGETLGLRFSFKLIDSAGNDLQGKTLKIGLNVMASQVLLAPIP